MSWYRNSIGHSIAAQKAARRRWMRGQVDRVIDSQVEDVLIQATPYGGPIKAVQFIHRNQSSLVRIGRAVTGDECYNVKEEAFDIAKKEAVGFIEGKVASLVASRLANKK